MPFSTCGGCGEVFTSTTLFDAHRVGSFQKRTRRCLTLAELQTAGYQSERKSIKVYHAGHSQPVEREVWFDPAARELMRQAFNQVKPETSTPTLSPEPVQLSLL